VICFYLSLGALDKVSHILTLRYITLHSLDPKLVKMTAGCGTSHTNTKTHIQYN
jgi:hypothetical protein